MKSVSILAILLEKSSIIELCGAENYVSQCHARRICMAPATKVVVAQMSNSNRQGAMCLFTYSLLYKITSATFVLRDHHTSTVLIMYSVFCSVLTSTHVVRAQFYPLCPVNAITVAGINSPTKLRIHVNMLF